MLDWSKEATVKDVVDLVVSVEADPKPQPPEVKEALDTVVKMVCAEAGVESITKITADTLEVGDETRRECQNLLTLWLKKNI